ncbi:MAG: hypothetical protein JWP91_2234 [Fibrobacteres bacterium]|nr:hypothetical protein [Fibrobacterota bacterium]
MGSRFLKPCLAACLAAVSVFGAAPVSGADVTYRISGQGWAEAGRIVHSTDTLLANMNGNALQSAGAQFTAFADIGDQWEGAFGIGGYQAHHMQGSGTVSSRNMQFYFRNFITESRMTWYRGEKADPSFSLTFGNFNYDYNPDIKNLGLYLFRGSVYPGFLQSGFMDPSVDETKGDILGLKAHHRIGKFSQDLVFANERQLPPAFDWSLGYVGKFRPMAGLEFGAGFNLYRVLSANSDLTTPDNAEYFSKDSAQTANGGTHPNDHFYTEGRIDTLRNAQGQPVMDTATGLARLHYIPTVTYTHKGIKLMGMAGFDPKKAFGFGGNLGEDDLKVYAEAALIGVRNYGRVYADRSQRMPVVFGFNLPAFRLLDIVSLEVEWYGARYRNNIAKLTQQKFSELPSPIPVSYNSYDIIAKNGLDSATGRILRDSVDADGNIVKVPGPIRITGTALDVENLTQDDWKWSLFLQKTVRGHIRFTGQIANDHFRPQPTHTLYADQPGTGTSESSSSLKDWYFMLRMGYFF